MLSLLSLTSLMRDDLRDDVPGRGKRRLERKSREAERSEEKRMQHKTQATSKSNALLMQDAGDSERE